MYSALLIGFVACLVTVLVTPLVIRICRIRNIVDRPDETRKIHRRPIPRCGGVGIVFSFFAALSVLLLIHDPSTSYLHALMPQITKILLVSLSMFALGLLDDLRGGIRASWKLSLQVAASILLWWLGFRIQTVVVPSFGYIDLGLIGGLLLTVFWQVLVTNAFNFIDGMDGLAAGIAFVVSSSVLAVGIVTQKPEVVFLAAPLAGALIGFLIYNWSPARIFMGDSGSYFLGFLLGAMSILCSSKSSTMLSFTVPVIMLGIPILDTVLTVGRRLIKSEPLFKADGDHIHHRLLKRGYHQTLVVFILYGLTLLMAILAALSILLSPTPYAVLIPLAMGVISVWLVWHLGYDEFHELADMTRRLIRFQRVVLSNQVRIRRYQTAIRKAENPLQLFGHLSSFLKEMHFEHMTLNLVMAGRDGQDSRAFSWSWNNSGQVGVLNTWSISIPLELQNGCSGTATLSRQMEWERVMFQMASLLYLFNVILAQSLARLDCDELLVFLGQHGGMEPMTLLDRRKKNSVEQGQTVVGGTMNSSTH